MIYKIYIRLFVIDINCDRMMTGRCWLLQQLLRHAHSGGRIGSVRIRPSSCVGLGDFCKFTITAISRCIFHWTTGDSQIFRVYWRLHDVLMASGQKEVAELRCNLAEVRCSLHRIIWEESFWFMWNKEDRFEVFSSMSCSKTWLVS